MKKRNVKVKKRSVKVRETSDRQCKTNTQVKIINLIESTHCLKHAGNARNFPANYQVAVHDDNRIAMWVAEDPLHCAAHVLDCYDILLLPERRIARHTGDILF